MKTELAAVFDPLDRRALPRVATFILRWPDLFGPNLQIDLAHHPKRRALVAVARADQMPPDARWRFAFWCAQLGARALTPAALPDAQRQAFTKLVADCPMRVVKIETSQLFASMKKLLGADAASLNPNGIVELEVVLGGAGPSAATVVADGGRYSIHVPTIHAPPMNDGLRVAVLLQGERHVADGVVTSVVRPANASPVRPAGFLVRLDAPPRLVAALKLMLASPAAAPAPRSVDHDPRRASARVAMQAPVKVAAPIRVARAVYESDAALLAVATHLDERRLPVEAAVRPPIGAAFTLELCLPDGIVARAAAVVAAHADAAIVVTFTLEDDEDKKLEAALARARGAQLSPSVLLHGPPSAERAPRPPPREVSRQDETKEDVTATISYDSEEALAADYVENLSKGGAFIKTETPAAMDSLVSLDIQLLDGGKLTTMARVVWIGNGGMGVQFQLDAQAKAVLDALLDRIASPPRRALVVLADLTLATEVVAGLVSSTFHVLRANGKDEGLSTLFDELLDLDLLVVDSVAMEGRSLVDIVRDAGEADLPIVAVGAHAPRANASVDSTAGVGAIVDACRATATRKP